MDKGNKFTLPFPVLSLCPSPQDQHDSTHGVALELQGEEALDYLNNREMTLGGYSQQITLFHPAPDQASSPPPPFPVLVFVASPNSGPYWLGPASPQEIAEQVLNRPARTLTDPN